ncbi:MAG: M48 family metallopeptidase [Candidatus Omnitrophota bacterium]
MAYTKEEAKRYNRIKIRLKLLDIILTVCYLGLFQAFLSSPLKSYVFGYTSNFYAAFGVYLTCFMLLGYLVNFPFSFFSGFILERRFKLSNQSFSAWAVDDVKKSLLSLVLYFIFIQVLYVFLRNFPTDWWIWIACFWFITTVVLAKISPAVIIPLFFKYQPVDELLKKNVMELSKICGIKILNVYKIDFSKKTNKMNAAVVGLGNTRRVLLADNLINNFNQDEINGVLAHEFAHHKMMHMWKMLVFGMVSIFFSFFMLFVISSKVVILFNAEGVADMAIFPAFMLVLFLAGFLTMPLHAGFSRRLERHADTFALKVTQNKNAFISLMTKLQESNLADPNPSKLIKFLFYDHPPISERIQSAKDFEA